MKIFGAVSRLTGIFFRKNSNDVGLRANQATTYTATRNSDLPPGDTDHVLVSANSTQVLTNKDIDGGTASNTSRITVPKGLYSSLLLLTRKEGTILYATDLDQFYSDDGTNLNPIGSGSAGGINYIDAPSTATGWSFTTNFGTSATTQTAGDLPLGGTIETAILLRSVGVNTEALENASYSFTTPEVGGVKTPVSFFMRPGTGFASNEWTISIYQGSTRQPLSTDSSSITYIPNTSGQFATTFSAVKNTTYTVRFSRINGTGTAVLNVAQVFVGLQQLNQGAVVEKWLSYTPTLTNIPTSATAGRYRRVGDSMEVDVSWTASGAATGDIAVPLPSGFTADASAVATTTYDSIGTGFARIASVNYTGVATYANTTTVNVVSNSDAGQWDANTPAAWSSGSLGRIRFVLPIAEWAGSGTVNLASNDVQWAYNSSTSNASDTTSFGYGPIGALIPPVTASAKDYRVRFTTPIQPTDQILLEFDYQGVGKWIEFEQSVIGNVLDATHGVQVYRVTGSETDLDVRFASAGFNTTSTSGGAAWTTLTTSRWRLRKCTGGQAVGFGEVVPGQSSGLVASAGLKGRIDGGTVAAGYVGERLVSTVTAVSVSTSITNLTSLSVTPGVWLLTGAVQYYGANGNAFVVGGISPTSASVTGTTQGYDRFVSGAASANGAGAAVIPGKYISISATTTYYLIGQLPSVTTTCDGFIQAVRVA